MPKSGLVLGEFVTKKGIKVLLRYPEISDAAQLTEFINAFSKENTFTRFSGEQFSLEEEYEYLEKELSLIDSGDVVKLLCFIEGKLAGICDVHRDTSLLSRKKHSGNFGLIVSKEFRGQGLGELLFRTTMEEARKYISGLRQFKLSCFANNAPALGLYKKIGFTEVGRIPEALYHKDGYVDEVIMTQKI